MSAATLRRATNTPTDEMVAILKLANEHLFPVTARGGGVGYTGGAVPVDGGIVIGTAMSNLVLTLLEARRLRNEIGGLEIARTLRAAAIMVAAAVLLAGIAYGTWYGLDQLLGRSLPAQIVSVGVALILGGAAYAAVVLRSGLPEARQILDLFARRIGPSRSAVRPSARR